MDTPTAYVIERDVPILTSPSGRHANNPIGAAAQSLQPGESFFVPGKNTSQVQSHLAAPRKAGRVFLTRKAPGGCRIWRLVDAEAV